MDEKKIAEVNSSEDKVITGYACVFNKPTVIYEEMGIEYKEVIDQNSFVGVDLSDVVLRYNHNDCFEILARTSNNTLKLEVDEIGLKFTAELADTTQGNDIYKLIQRKDITKMSFGFSVLEDEYNRQTYTRTIKKFYNVFDVSVVDFPAYEDTSVDVLKTKVKEDELKQKIQILANI